MSMNQNMSYIVCHGELCFTSIMLEILNALIIRLLSYKSAFAYSRAHYAHVLAQQGLSNRFVPLSVCFLLVQ